MDLKCRKCGFVVNVQVLEDQAERKAINRFQQHICLESMQTITIARYSCGCLGIPLMPDGMEYLCLQPCDRDRGDDHYSFCIRSSDGKAFTRWEVGEADKLLRRIGKYLAIGERAIDFFSTIRES